MCKITREIVPFISEDKCITAISSLSSHLKKRKNSNAKLKTVQISKLHTQAVIIHHYSSCGI